MGEYRPGGFDLINIDNVYKKAIESIKRDKINMDDFSSLYGEDNIKHDKNIVEDLKRKFKEKETSREIESKKLATIFESILNEHAELSEWLGGNVTTMVASEYDDLVNGVDMIAEFSEEGRNPSHLGLAIDATFSSNFDSKFRKIKDQIESGELSTIKYFNSTNMDFMGRLSQVPRVIIGVDNKTIIELIELNKKELAEHPVQFQILEEMIDQLEAFEKYARKIGQDALANKYQVALGIVNEIYDQRRSLVKDTGKRDSLFEEISDYTSHFCEE